MLDLLTALWLGFLGSCLGSFVNVVAYRVPRGMSVVWKPSHCPRCNHPIRARDNIPVLGWLLLGGRCRDCQGKIAPRYALVEAVLGIAFFALAYGELFAGGAGLFGPALTDLRGASQVVWNPHWPALALFALHGVLICAQVATFLLWMDGNMATQRLALILVAILIAWHGCFVLISRLGAVKN